MIYSGLHHLSAVALYIAVLVPVTGSSVSAEQVPVRVDFFFEASCGDCREIRRDILPMLAERFSGYYRLFQHDIGIESNVLLLAAYQEELAITSNAPVCMVLDFTHVLNGIEAIRRNLLTQVDDALALRQLPGWEMAKPVRCDTAKRGRTLLEQRARRFTVGMIVSAGFIDGLNPCAISTLVFLVSILVVTGQRGSKILVAGLMFCLASFLTYTLIGLGLLHVLHGSGAFPWVQRLVEWGLLTALGIAAFMSFRDAVRYHATGDARTVRLQLPDAIKRLARQLGRRMLIGTHPVTGAFLAGAGITALESVCTGQVYLPTLAVIVKTQPTAWREWMLLLTYNAMFMVPLFLVFAIGVWGLRLDTMLAWSRRHVVVSKILLGCLFLVLAGCLILL